MAASAVGRSGGRWGRIRAAVLERDDYRCQRCGLAKGASSLEVHHVKPRHLGGDDRLSNLKTMCVPCHLIETRRCKNPQRAVWEAYLLNG